MKRGRKKKVLDVPDAFDKVAEKKKKPLKEAQPVVEDEGLGSHGPETRENAPMVHEPDVEEVSESEVAAMIERAEERKREEKEKIEAEVDDQAWSRSDPAIPEELEGRVWVAVYKCPHGHKTKATNRQAKTGVRCWDCGEKGQVVKAHVMPQFLQKPEPPADDIEKRKAAAKGRV